MSGAEVVGLILAGPALIDFVVKFAGKIIQKMEQSKNMKVYIQHLRSFTVRTGHIRLKQDVELGKRILKDPSVGPLDKDGLTEVFNHALQTLRDMEVNVNIVLEKADAVFSRKKRVALTKLGDQSRDLEFTLDTFHDMVISLSLLQASESLLFLDNHDFAIIGPEQNRLYLNSGTFIAKGRLSKVTQGCAAQVQVFLFESKLYKQQGQSLVKKDLALLTQHLKGARIAEGILPIVGFRNEPSKEEFQLVFEIDDCMSNGRTLRNRFCLCEDTPSLNIRMALCADLAEAILHVHSLGLVHKNIGPENVFLVPDEQQSKAKLFLLGWQYARKTENFQTRRMGEIDLERRIYQHPDRQVQVAERDYCMGHDIYSLGVCLLEILTWSPLLQFFDNARPSLSSEFKATFTQLGYDNVGGERHSKERSEEDDFAQQPLRIQQVLIALGRAKLPTLAGDRMAGIVDRCLTCLESEEGLGGGSGFQETGRNEKEIGANFVDAVLKEIRGVSSAI